MSSPLFTFPDPVNEVSARLVAAGVLAMVLAAIAFDVRWLTAALAYGFVARVLTGPTLSPLGQLVTRVVTPRLRIEPRYVPGPPKRFAQGIGVAFSVTALGLCLGCKAFAVLMRLGVIPERICERCADLWGRRPVKPPTAPPTW